MATTTFYVINIIYLTQAEKPTSLNAWGRHGLSESCIADGGAVQRDAVQLHLPKPADEQAWQTSSSLIEFEAVIAYPKSAVLYDVILQRIVRKTRCSAVTFTPDHDLFDCQTPTTRWGGCVGFQLFSLHFVQMRQQPFWYSCLWKWLFFPDGCIKWLLTRMIFLLSQIDPLFYSYRNFALICCCSSKSWF